MDNPFKSPVILSFCPGILGLERGLERAIGKVAVAAYVEIEAFIIANLVAAMEAGVLAPAPVWTDAKTFNATPFRGKIHGIIGGYPCQPFSVAGKQLGEEDPRHLWPYLRQHINAAKPVWCFFENVRAHLTMGYDTVYKELRNLGYAVECGIYTAEEVGAPHERERLFILALANTTCKSQIRQYIRERTQQPILGKPGNQLGNTHSQQDQRHNEGRFFNQSGRTGIDVVNPPHQRCDTGPDDSGEGKRKGSKNKQRSVDGIRSEPVRSSTGKLANACSKGLERCGNGKISDGKKFPLLTRKGFDGWPARPNEDQYQWEEKRVIEPGLGCTVNGYNFRDDLLRAYGNSVVEQTAELAFIDLISKHLYE